NTGTTAGPGGDEINLTFLAVDPQSFAQTVTPARNQPLDALLRQLGKPTDQTSSIPVIIDQSLALSTNLRVGTQFGISLSSISTEQITFRVLAVVAQIPGAPDGMLT